MNLIWKLLRQHISIPQFAGFFLANLVGMLIIMLGAQFYADTQAVFDSEDSFMKDDFLIINKKISTLASASGNTNTFLEDELEDLEDQSFVEKIGAFTSSAFKVRANFDMPQLSSFSTEMFFESVPDEFVDIQTDEWTFQQGSTSIPIILPKNYLDLYNFGYAQSRNMPKLSEGILGALKMNISIEGNGHSDAYEGKIVGFSSRLNTILVPQAFMEWANDYYAQKTTAQPTRLILLVENPADEQITQFLEEHNYQTDKDKLKASKTNFFLRVIASIVMLIGLVISVLSFYILMLSIYLLVQKNSQKLENLLLLGYSPAKVAFPYQMLTIGLNLLVLLMAFGLVCLLRRMYLHAFESFFPDMEIPTLLPAMIVGLALFLVVSVLNILVIKQKVLNIWKKKNS